MKNGKNHRVYLQDILCAIVRIEEYTTEGKAAFFADGKTQDAVIRQFSILGEAAAKLPASVKKNHADIPWKKIIGMRNIIIHDYADTDLPTIWDTVQRGLQPLRNSVEDILKQMPHSSR